MAEGGLALLWGGGKDSIGQRERFSLFRFSGTRGGLACEAEFETEGAGTFLQMKRPHRLTSVPRTTAVPCWVLGDRDQASNFSSPL